VSRRRRPPLKRTARAGKLARLLLIGGACLIAALYYRPVRAYLGTRHTLSQRAAEVRVLAAEKRSLERRVAATASAGGADLVQAARRLGLVKPGEHLYIVQGIRGWLRAHAQHRG
jgi:cell division protein FtsB